MAGVIQLIVHPAVVHSAVSSLSWLFTRLLVNSVVRSVGCVLDQGLAHAVACSRVLGCSFNRRLVSSAVGSFG